MTDVEVSGRAGRQAGILLHITSLPGRHGIGDLGHGAGQFLDFLAAGGQQLWQILPLTPLGHGNSPYASPSAMAGNPLLLSLDRLFEDGLLAREDLVPDRPLPDGRVDYDAATAFKFDRLRRAHERFASGASATQRPEMETFCSSASSWLEDYALFMALKDAHAGAAWLEWEPEIVRREAHALDDARGRLAHKVDFYRFVQFQFARQWSALRGHANERGVRIIGDVPIFVALDSADVWANQHLFFLEENGRPTYVAGVPPDYFSRTGQRWGNPLYRWNTMRENGYAWWIERFRAALAQVDVVRIDHFRGFQAFWEIPAENETAEHGRWVEGPGEDFFLAVKRALGELPVIAENLGIITPEVEQLRLSIGYPGMKVLHFAFDDGPSNPYLPHNYERRCVAYTGTHDNDTTLGWFGSRSREEQERVRRYVGRLDDPAWDLIRMLYQSVAEMVIVPMQDVLELGAESRMNMPGEANGNWGWRVLADQLTPDRSHRLNNFVTIFGRGPSQARQ